jgi:hypothetical protein
MRRATLRGIPCLYIVVALLLAGCASTLTPAQDLSWGAFDACKSNAIESVKLRKVNPNGSFVVGHDSMSTAEQRVFLDCVRPYFAAHALQGIAHPGPDTPAAQRQGYDDLDECLRGGVRVRATGIGGAGEGFLVLPPVIRITALNEDGSFRWDGDAPGGNRLTSCMRAKAAGIPQQASEVSPAPSEAAGIDGVYGGQVCYGPSPNGEPDRCYQAKATVRDGKLVGEWPGREGITVKLAGEVSTIGEVKIEMHAERTDGSQFARANLSGTIQKGHLDANGAFFNGRIVSIRWTWDLPGGDAPEKESGGREHAYPSGLKRK